MGLLLTVWVVGIRGLLHDRAVLDRWIGEVTAALRSAAEELVATRVLAAEAALTAELPPATRRRRPPRRQLTLTIDAELREHAVADGGAAACATAGPRLQRHLQREL